MDEHATSEPAAIVLAAGKSTRMKSDLPKVLHELCGQPLLAYVLAALEGAGIRRKVLVVGYRGDLVRERFANTPGVEFVEQTEQKGTGHAVDCCRDAFVDHAGPVVVLAGDGPLIRAEMIEQMLQRSREGGMKAFLATATMSNPFGMGRIVRNAEGRFDRIVEQKDCTPEEAAIQEVNGSFYVFDSRSLFEALAEVKPANAQGEYYLTDVPGILRKRGDAVDAEILADEIDVHGVNHRRHLADAHVLMQQRIQSRHLDAGVTIVDPGNTYIDARAEIGRDTVIQPFTVIGGPATIGERCHLGPFAHVRAGTVLEEGAQVGAFVEIVRSTMGKGATAKHLAYLGDATLGEGVNVGAGLVTANYDQGVKSQTTVGDGAFLGSGAVLVAPVAVGAKSVVGAGAVVTKNQTIAEGEVVAGVPARPLEPKGESSS
ncbi:Bifunctional protein GlmU [Planctomycetes bacterium Pan216]|uniref:Bifunctional protein GlmU n=1 Tax=Kolteria novifilia TaxID=2527975 RepID=A0A518B2F0_9BACT|nr:Bifunctional protein GlmU [Planctomycetes bacterium Pan216]